MFEDIIGSERERCLERDLKTARSECGILQKQLNLIHKMSGFNNCFWCIRMDGAFYELVYYDGSHGSDSEITTILENLVKQLNVELQKKYDSFNYGFDDEADRV